MDITASVGKDGANKRDDIEIVQKLLNLNIGSIVPLRPLEEDGRIGPNTINAIETFQRRVVRLSRPDGRVDPKGKTLLALNKAIGGTTAKSAKVTYSSKLATSKKIVSPYAISVIKLALQDAGMPHAVITSTIRTPEEQANIMYKNAEKNLAKQFELYGATGDEVLKVYKANKNNSKAEKIKLMKEKIETLLKQGRRTSKHVVTAAQYNNLNIIDVGVNSTRAKSGQSFSIKKFTSALKALQTKGYINKMIDETKKSNTCWHIEIKPNKKPLPQ